jgi:Mg/Co/Ni transporter MgtE
MGFGPVYDYAPGKVDWLARGLPTEGRDAGAATAGSLARRDVATCTLDTPLHEARKRAAAAGGVCVVTNEDRVVLGLLREKEFAAADDDAPVPKAMRPGPSTFRPHVAVKEMAEYMTKHNLESAPITSADGRLIGVLYRDVAVHAAHNGS